ncbi:Gramicidin S synthase 1 [Fundidesulfovibrio magnetotacticus]|uniref:Gramicidin S synthase 1 n=2 Tax=Fundidesulfovibrio magnetotacticus TaxID=2730080 RepID=A0A6V8LY08_9BACT|nr:Gramicidin S synthase 1 [Fundidesulfovibrio magnetotacticus]
MERVAALLVEQGVKRGDRVGIYGDNRAEMIVGILGTLRADACYVPLSAAFPPLRVQAIAQDCQVRCIISSTAHLKQLAQYLESCQSATLRTILITDGEHEHLNALAAITTLTGVAILGKEHLEGCSTKAPPCSNIEEDLMYLMYTSGSTGTPKGVMLTHRNVKALLGWILDTLEIDSSSRVSNHSNITFDTSVLDIFGAFWAGATLYPVVAFGDKLVPTSFIKNNAITHWLSVPSVIGFMAKMKTLQPGALGDAMKVVVLYGEGLSWSHPEALRAASPATAVFNMYGPTEATVLVTIYKVPSDVPEESMTGYVPIGKPCPGVEMPILKTDSDAEAGCDEIGRLTICGTQLAEGYWKRPDLTQAAFRANPLKPDNPYSRMYFTGDLARKNRDGDIVYVGREDMQIKIAGTRIELSEIEGVLTRHPALSEVAVVALHETDPITICACYCLKDGGVTEIPDNELKTHCAKHLQEITIPRRFFTMDALPHNANGKIDRNAILQSIRAQLNMLDL